MKKVSVYYKNHSERFSKQSTVDFNNQYCSIYNARLSTMRQLLEDRIRRKWGTEYPICRLHKLSEANYDKCIVVGTLFKDQKLKPSVLKQLAESNHLIPQPIVTHFTDESDVLYIEDELQRYQLLGPLKCADLVTGITCACLGTDMGKGKFMVSDYCFADCRPQLERPLLQDDTFVVFVSGLDLIHSEKFTAQLYLFVMWLNNQFSFDDVDISKIVRLIIAGDSVKNDREKVKSAITLTSRKGESDDVIRAVKMLDNILVYLSQVMNVDVMPGENDPSSHVLPQKSMHNCMFPKSAPYKSLQQVPNPYDCEIGRVKIIGTSGQPVNDIRNYSDIEQPIDALEKCLTWNHLAPTAPDTLGCYPYYDSDPFILEDCPHVLFTGNQDEFATKIHRGPDGQQVRLICIPQFSKTYSACILNLKTLECSEIFFRT